MQPHEGIAGSASHAHAGDGRHHCFAVLGSGDVFEASFTSLHDRSSLTELWLGKREVGAVALASFSTSDGGQHVFVAGRDGLVHPLEIGSSTNWRWAWRAPITAVHDRIVGLCAYYHPYDDGQHVFISLESGDVWEAVSARGSAWTENWVGILDGGAVSLAGHSASNGTQHLFAAGPPGWVLPLQIGPPHWKWRWDERVLSRQDGVAGLASYFHPGDGQQHVFAARRSGDIWESRFPLRTHVATREWGARDLWIGYWDGPPGLDDLAARYQQVVDAGFTLAMPTNAGGTLATNPALLAAAGTVGLRMFLHDDIVQGIGLQSKATGLSATDKQDLQRVIDTYSGHSAFAGCMLWGSHKTDELFPDDFPINAEMVAFFRQNDPGHACFLEILPNYSPPENHAPYEYPAFVETYASTVKPAALCFHNYALQAAWGFNIFYSNLRIVREVALAHGIPFGQFVCSIEHGDFKLPTEAEADLRRQAMHVLAFGGTFLLWFTYVREPGWGPAIIEPDGTPTPHYAQVQRVNADLRAIGKYLLGARSIAVYETGLNSNGGTPVPSNGLVQLQNAADVTIGVFSVGAVPSSSSANRALVMLASRDAASTVSARLKLAAASVQKLDKKTGSWGAAGSSSASGAFIEMEVVLEPGDGELLSVFAP
jgi:hypothetical protein